LSNSIAFISPKSSFYFRSEKKSNYLTNLPGFSLHLNFWSGIGTALPMLASITPDEYECVIIDENVEEIDYSKEYKMVCITAMTHQAIRAYQIAGEFRKRKIHTVIGGVHIHTMYEEALNFCDTVVIGEAESLWPVLLNDFKLGKIKSLYNGKDFDEVDISKLPVPRYDLLKDKNYSIMWLNTSRGCPYDCEFCSVTNLFGKKYRHKTVNQIVKEIEEIKRVFKKIYIGFSDDNMFVNRTFSTELMERFKEMNFRWVCQSDISIGKDKEFLNKLYEGGCHVIFIGFESLDEKNLTGIYKETRKLKSDYLSQYSEMVYNIQSNGIGILGSFIIGLDNDKKEAFDDIVNFIDKTNMLTATINILTPLPGTRLRERLLNEGRVIPTSWENYTFWDVNFIPKMMSYKEIENGMLNAFEKIYSLERMKKTTSYFKEIFKKKLGTDLK